MATAPLVELIQFKAPKGFSQALDALADRTFEPRAALIRRALMQLLLDHGVTVDELCGGNGGNGASK
jgi:hypothetical protein